MGKKSRRPRQKNAKQAIYKPDPDVIKLVDQLLKVCIEATRQEPPKTPKEQWDDFVEIRKLLDELEAKQAEADDGFEARPARCDCVDAFLDWLTQNGAEARDVTFGEFPGRGFGVKAIKSIKKHEIFFSIPYSLMITTLSMKDSLLGSLVQKDRLLRSVPSIGLSLHLLVERWNPDSFWRPYIDMLPESYTIPLYYTVDEVRMLQGSTAYLDALNQNRMIARQYAYLHQMMYSHRDAREVVLSQKPFNYADFRWAVGSVMTRQNNLPVPDGDGFAIGLIPGWDMCNHANGVITTDYKDDEKALKCYAVDDFEADSEVTTFYGTRTNAEFLLNQGFVYERNQHDRMKLKLGVSKNDPLYALKAQLLTRLDIPTSAAFYLYNALTPFTAQLMAFLRAFCMTYDELKAKLEGSDEDLQVLLNPRGVVSRECETKALDFIQTRCTLLLKQYKTSLSEDEAQSIHPDASPLTREIVKFLYGEKSLLSQVIAFTQTQKAFLQSHYLTSSSNSASTEDANPDAGSSQAEAKTDVDTQAP